MELYKWLIFLLRVNVVCNGGWLKERQFSVVRNLFWWVTTRHRDSVLSSGVFFFELGPYIVGFFLWATSLFFIVLSICNMDLTVTSRVYLVGELDPIPQVIQSFERLKKRKKKTLVCGPCSFKDILRIWKTFYILKMENCGSCLVLLFTPSHTAPTDKLICIEILMKVKWIRIWGSTKTGSSKHYFSNG